MYIRDNIYSSLTYARVSTFNTRLPRLSTSRRIMYLTSLYKRLTRYIICASISNCRTLLREFSDGFNPNDILYRYK